MHLVKNENTVRQGETFQKLVTDVLQRTINPEDRFEVAAVLESMGWNDRMANERFGSGDIFNLAEDIWNALQKRLLVTPLSKMEKLTPWQYFTRIVRSFLRGMIFALPMAVSVVAMLTLRFSLWSYQYLSLEQATAISIGTILSFIIVGGFTQAVARRGFLYIGQGHYHMARKTVYFFVRIGYFVCFVAGLGFLMFNTIFPVYPWSMTLLIVLFLYVLSGIWLSVTIMYILQKELTFTGLITAGIGLVFVLFVLLKINIVVSQLISISIVAILSIFIVRYYFYKAEKEMEKGIAPVMPRRSMTLYTTLPYFSYGFLYFAFLNIDRIIAWSTNNSYMPYLIWFRGEYELGLDFALLILIFPMGLVEVVVNEIMANLVADQKNYPAVDITRMNKAYTVFYRKRIIIVALFSALNGIILFLLVRLLSSSSKLEIDVFGNRITLFVFVIAVIAYGSMVIGLMNSLILFSLSQPIMVVRSIMIALAINILVGFTLSRWIDYSWSVLGLLAGSLLFLIISTRWVLKVLNKLDYYLYNAM